jgi:hypothetical protein
MAASSPEGESFVWNTTPKEPLPTILHWVYCISRVSPVTPSCTFSRITSTISLSVRARGIEGLAEGLTSHSQTREGCRPVLRHLELQNDFATVNVVG